MQQQLNTPEDLRAIRQAMDEGKNPLVETDVPRWEDQVGISRIVNRRVLEFEVLPTPAQVLGDLPLSEQAQEIVAYSRDEIRACLYGQDDRLLVVVGPCSVHDPKAALDYARRLSALKGELDGELLIVMRVYFEKPRTTVGWKGLINDPDIDGSCNIRKGLLLARRTLLGVLDQGLAGATGVLGPARPPVIFCAVCLAMNGRMKRACAASTSGVLRVRSAAGHNPSFLSAWTRDSSARNASSTSRGAAIGSAARSS